MVVSLWDEELVIYMTRGTWADLLDGKLVGTTSVIGQNMIRVERKKEKKNGTVTHKKKTS